MVPVPDVSREDRKRLRKALSPLRAIFWGGLFCIFDFNLAVQATGGRRAFDVLNDGLGMLLITGGVIALASENVDSTYDALLSFAIAVAGLWTFGAFSKQLFPLWFGRLQPLMPYFQLVGLVATVGFCMAMKRLCAAVSQPPLARSWRTTALLFAYSVGSSSILVVVLYLLLPGASRVLAYATYLVVAGYVLSLGHLFVSTSRMASQARRYEPKTTPGGAM